MEAWIVSQYAALPKSDRAAIQDAIGQVTDVIPTAGEEPNYEQPPYPGGVAGAEIQTLISEAASFVKYDGTDAFWSQFSIVTNAGLLYMAGQDLTRELIAYTPTAEPGIVRGGDCGSSRLPRLGAPWFSRVASRERQGQAALR